MTRNYNLEHQDTHERKYAYNFDYILHHYMIESFRPFFTGNRALELGCYHGEFTKHIIQNFAQVTVIEGSDSLIEIAKKNVSENIRFIHDTFEQVALGEKFDAIFLIHTLEHLDDPVLVLKRISSWLSPNGKLFLAVPNANAASRQIAVEMGLINHNQAVTEGEYQHGHRKTYAMDTLLHEIRRSKLHSIAHGGILFKPLANFQIDKALEAGIINQDYLAACYQLGMKYPDLCASIFTICEPIDEH